MCSKILEKIKFREVGRVLCEVSRKLITLKRNPPEFHFSLLCLYHIFEVRILDPQSISPFKQNMEGGSVMLGGGE